MKIMVIGSRSFVARTLIPALKAARFDTVDFARPDVSITYRKNLHWAIDIAMPELIINCAAQTNTAEIEKGLMACGEAYGTNYHGVALLAEICHARNIALMHFSTDYVFSGEKGKAPYHEEDATFPANQYGRSKLFGEKSIRSTLERHVILRTAWLYGMDGRNFLAWLVLNASAGAPLVIPDNQWGSPTWVVRLADTVVKLCARMETMGDSFPWGTYHAAGQGTATWYMLAKALLLDPRWPEHMWEAGKNMRPSFSHDPWRPIDSTLDCTKLGTTFGIVYPPWRREVTACLASLGSFSPIPPADAATESNAPSPLSAQSHHTALPAPTE